MLNCGHGRVGRFWTSRLSGGWGVVMEKLVGDWREKVGKCGGKSEEIANNKNGCGIMGAYR